MVSERKVLEVHITKGMRNGQKITFHGEADEAPGVVPGDIIFIVEEKVRVLREPFTAAAAVTSSLPSLVAPRPPSLIDCSPW